MRRTVTATLIVGLLLAGALPLHGQEATPGAPVADPIGGGNITPPGNSGHVPSTRLAAALAGDYQPPHALDQRDPYVAWEMKDWSFTTPEEAAELGDALHPAGRRDVSIHYDHSGVPVIFGDTGEAAQFGVGYAMATQRLFQADVFRHVARGEMAGFLGGQEWYDYDRAWRKEFYTDEELLAMFETSYTAEQQRLVQAYLDGVNAYIDEALADPQKLPAEYVALGIRPEPWELRHALAVFVLQARDSVEGFGQELANAVLLTQLESRLGDQDGDEVFADLRWYRDPGAYTTTPPEEAGFPYAGGGFEGLDASGVVRPDDAEEAAAVLAHDTALMEALRLVGLGRKQASNAVTISGDLTAHGGPILLGGPQLDYLAPSIFWEFEAHSPDQHARGVGFAGTAGAVLIGKTPTHAWTITYGYTDQVDVFLVPLDPDRSDTHYLRDGESQELQGYTSTVRCKADQVGLLSSPAADDLCDGLPANQADVEVERVPEYGPVIGRVSVGGAPHAVVKVRGHWMREVSNGLPFLTLNRPATRGEIRQALGDFSISLNINYVDVEGHVGYWHVARPPIRADGTDVRLPTIGDGSHDWQGTIPLDDVPHTIDPDQGFTANWNNQVAVGWHNGDQNSWGDIQRVDVLARGMEQLAGRGRITPDDVWALNREAAHADIRFLEVGDRVIRALGPGSLDDDERAALELLASWDGQRTSSETDTSLRYDDAAVAIWDRLFARFQEAVFADEVGSDVYDALFVDLDPDFYYLAMPVAVRVIKGDAAPLPPAHDWLDGVAVDVAIREAFTTAVAELDRELGGDPATWRGEAALTEYTPVGLLSVEPHRFMNRGTYNQLAVVAHDPGRPGGGLAPPPARDEAPSSAPLPTTGGGLATIAIGLLAFSLLARRRR